MIISPGASRTGLGIAPERAGWDGFRALSQTPAPAQPRMSGVLARRARRALGAEDPLGPDRRSLPRRGYTPRGQHLRQARREEPSRGGPDRRRAGAPWEGRPGGVTGPHGRFQIYIRTPIRIITP